MEDSLAEMYLEKIKAANNPIPLFVAFFSSLFPVDSKDFLYPIFGRLYKVYGRDILFFAILDVYSMDEIDATSPAGILSYFCKKRLETRFEFYSLPSLDKLADSVLHKTQKKTPIKTPKNYKGSL